MTAVPWVRVFAGDGDAEGEGPIRDGDAAGQCPTRDGNAVGEGPTRDSPGPGDAACCSDPGPNLSPPARLLLLVSSQNPVR